MLDPHRLSIFRSVMASGSIQAAADNLAMTSSAVSQHMTALQKQTGLDLFDRVGRGIVPTAAAEALLAHSDDAMNQWTRLDSLVDDLREGRSGRLVLGYFASAGAAWLPSVVSRLSREMPDLVVELVLTELNARSSLPDIDVTMDGTENARRPGYRKIPLADDPFVLAVPQGHPLATRRELALIDLKGERWVTNDYLSSPGHRLVAAACSARGFTPRYAVQAQDHYSAIAFVAAGVGITLLPRLAARAVPENVVLVPFSDPPVRHLVAMAREGGPRNRAVDRVLAILLELSQHPSRGSARGSGHGSGRGAPDAGEGSVGGGRT